jgi:hypothetical protein
MRTILNIVEARIYPIITDPSIIGLDSNISRLLRLVSQRAMMRVPNDAVKNSLIGPI